MDKFLTERIYTAVAGVIASVLAGAIVKRLWRLATGGEPPDPQDPKVSGRAAVGWFLLSSIGVGIAQLAMTRVTHKALVRRRPDSVTTAEA
jgi:hypothetical protein